MTFRTFRNWQNVCFSIFFLSFFLSFFPSFFLSFVPSFFFPCFLSFSRDSSVVDWHFDLSSRKFPQKISNKQMSFAPMGKQQNTTIQLILNISFECKKVRLQWNSVITNSVVNEHSNITNRFSGQIGHFTTQNNPVITNPGYNEQKWPVPSCSL